MQQLLFQMKHAYSSVLAVQTQTRLLEEPVCTLFAISSAFLTRYSIVKLNLSLLLQFRGLF